MDYYTSIKKNETKMSNKTLTHSQNYRSNQMEMTKDKTLRDSKLEIIQNRRGETSWNEQ